MKEKWKCYWIPLIDEERYMELGGVFFSFNVYYYVDGLYVGFVWVAT